MTTAFETIEKKDGITAHSKKNLLDAMHGEAFAYAKYRLFAEHARQHGHFELSEVFDRIANEEFFEHFKELAGLLQLVGTDEQDLHDAIASESIEIDSVYRNFAMQAREDGDVEVAEQFEEIRGDEAVHRLAFKNALTKLQTTDRIMENGKKRSA